MIALDPPGAVRVRSEGTIAVVELDDARANALGTSMLEALESALAAVIEADAVVLRGRASIFCGGLDLREVAGLRGASLLSFLALLHRTRRALFGLPRPLVVAVAGSAIGAGATLLCCGDRRLGARDRGEVGFPEVRLGVPLVSSARCIAQAALGRVHRHRALVLGETFGRGPGLAMGLFDDVVDPPALDAKAREAAVEASRLPSAVVAIKASLRRDLLRQMDAERDASHRAFAAAWSSDEAQRRISAVVERLDRRSRPSVRRRA